MRDSLYSVLPASNNDIMHTSAVAGPAFCMHSPSVLIAKTPLGLLAFLVAAVLQMEENTERYKVRPGLCSCFCGLGLLCSCLLPCASCQSPHASTQAINCTTIDTKLKSPSPQAPCTVYTSKCARAPLVSPHAFPCFLLTWYPPCLAALAPATIMFASPPVPALHTCCLCPEPPHSSCS